MCLQVKGHISTPEGKKVLLLTGLWNSRLDMVPCDEDGEAVPDATPTNLWTVSREVNQGCSSMRGSKAAAALHGWAAGITCLDTMPCGEDWETARCHAHPAVYSELARRVRQQRSCRLSSLQLVAACACVRHSRQQVSIAAPAERQTGCSRLVL